MDANAALVYVLLGGVLGTAGQGIRIVVGLKKQLDENKGKSWDEWFQTKQLVVSLIIALTLGGIAGVLGSIELLNTEVTRESMITLVAIGYAGTDFIEGFMKTKIPG